MTKAKHPSRRRLMKGVAALAGVAGTGFPTIWAQTIKTVTLRQFGSGVTSLPEIARKAKEDLGFTVAMSALDDNAPVQRAVTQPRSFDIMDCEYWMMPKIVPSGNLQPIDARKIKLFDKVEPIFTKGEVTGQKVRDQGTAPAKVAYLTGAQSKAFAKAPTEWLSLVPTICNADTLGIRPDLVGGTVDSWKALLDPKFRGKTSIVSIASIGIMDAAMVCEATGELTYRDKGNMTKEEIDRTVGMLTAAKHAGQFRSFWTSFDQSVNLMAAGEVVIQSMWSPAVTAVRAKGIPCEYVPLKEGYRAWGGGIALSKGLTGLERDAAYEYLNWYLSGWVGAFLNRQGYYPSVLATAKANMTGDEWGYWIEGKPAQSDIKDPFGKVMEKAGAVRDGGSFEKRMGNIACWNAVMDENRYMIQKWNEFIAS